MSFYGQAYSAKNERELSIYDKTTSPMGRNP